MTKEQHSWLVEKHISKQALPGEEILSWLKWKELDFDKIIIKSEADLFFQRFLNVDEEIFKQEDLKKGKAVIDKQMLQIEGFIGFGCVYTAIPNNERELSFVVEFQKNEQIIDLIELKTKIIRPILTVESQSAESIIVDKYNPLIPSLGFRLLNKGTGRIINASPFIDFQAKGMKIFIEEKIEKDTNTSPLFVYSTLQKIPKIIVNGKGFGMITLGFKYDDSIGNKYETKLVNIPIRIEQKERLEVPILSELEGQQALLLKPKVT